MMTTSAKVAWQVNPGRCVHTFGGMLNGYCAGSPLQSIVRAYRGGEDFLSDRHSGKPWHR